MKVFIAVLFLFISCYASAQPSDFLLLKKKGETIATYTSGSHISFTATDGNSVDADIISIKNDTLFMRRYDVRQELTTLGVYMMDTVNSYRIQYCYKDILTMPKTGRHFDLGSSGTSLLTGGILLTVAGGVVYLADRSQFSSGLLIAGASLGVIGYIMTRLDPNEIKIGRKYTLAYLNTIPTTK